MFSGWQILPFKPLNGPLDTKISRLGEFTHLQLQKVIILQRRKPTLFKQFKCPVCGLVHINNAYRYK